jgi:FKBP-type peptidyl-prolyl cis-trans isomerase 2
MNLIEYRVSVKTHSFESKAKQKSFVKKFVKFINSCNYKKVPGTMIEVSEDDVVVSNKAYVGATLSVNVEIVKPENGDKIKEKLSSIEKKLDVELLELEVIKSY